MKTVFGLLVVIGLVLGGIWLFGGYRTLDATKQGKEARAALKPGMTLQQVLDTAGPTPKFRVINVLKEMERGKEVEHTYIGQPVEFKHKDISKRLKDNKLPSGFILDYQYSNSVAFAVHFDGSGKVIGVEDEMTVGDLLNGKLMPGGGKGEDE